MASFKQSTIKHLGLLLAAFMLLSCGEEYSSEYENLKNPEAKLAIERGWLPSQLPPSSFNIQETHNIDSNECMGRFDFKAQDDANFIKQLKPIAFAELHQADDKKKQLLDMGLQFYKAEHFDFAVHRQPFYAWFWCRPPEMSQEHSSSQTEDLAQK